MIGGGEVEFDGVEDEDEFEDDEDEFEDEDDKDGEEQQGSLSRLSSCNSTYNDKLSRHLD